MNKSKQRHIKVHAHWAGLAEPTLVGTLNATSVRGREVFSFEYDHAWLKSNCAQALDPALQLFPGHQYAPISQDNFGVFLDSSPDRWGRFLMRRREAQLAREEKRDERNLMELDYLLGVHDGQRMGALRFRTHHDGPFLDNNEELASPPWTSLRELEQASLEIEKDDAEKNSSYSKWLKMLIAPGGSLGGARPKAGIMDEDNQLWIAKFPSNNDDYDVGAWEVVAHKLAKHSGIMMADAKIEKFNSRHHTFISKRFDRALNGERIHFASAMTLLQRSDGDDASNGASYLELAEFIARRGAQPDPDLEQLWRRIVFYICISNVDDHLRNHGFILTPTGWVLSPAFDINPVASGEGLKLNISETDNSQDLELAKDVAKYFRINHARANVIIDEVISATRQWRKEATAIGITASQQNQLARAFRLIE